MNMGKTAENRILAILANFLSFGFSPFLVTLAILILSTMLIIVTFKKKKVILHEKPVQDHEGLICEQKNIPGKVVGETLQPPLETAIQQNEVGLMHEYQVESTSDILVPSDSESSNDSVMGEKFDLNLTCSNYMEQNLAMSDISVSDDDDDDSLIEICLPGSKFGGPDEEPKQKLQSNLQSNLPDLLPESIFEQQGLMELLAEINEMNEEENLIEIDLGLHQGFKVSD
jgi:hypothetical protein